MTIHLPGLNLDIPRSVPDVDSNLLNPRDTWADKDAYDSAAASLIAKFEENFKRFNVEPGIVATSYCITRSSDSAELIEIAQWVSVDSCSKHINGGWNPLCSWTRPRVTY